MKRVLIFLREDTVLPKGGPSGYVYNLLSGIEKTNDIELCLLPSAKNQKINKQYQKLPLGIKKIYRVFGRYKDYRNLSKETEGITVDYLNRFDAIHFHSCFSLYRNIKLLKNYNGKVLLTSHCPKPPQLEKIEDMYSEIERKLYGKNHLKRYEQAVIDAFNRADYIIFPCEEAEEPYYNNWDKYKAIKKANREKYYYVPTGVASCLEKVKTTRVEIRKKYDIPQDAFLISYVGRHNEVKGYDTLKKIASTFTNKDGIYFLIAGEEAPLTRPNLSFWKEAGWTNDPYSIESASDLFVLPNKETYFDLVLLEVLSVGVKILATYTGGNKFFKQFDSDIVFFNDVNDGVSKILSIKNRSSEVSTKNRDLFLQQFTSQHFAKNYLALLNKLIV